MLERLRSAERLEPLGGQRGSLLDILVSVQQLEVGQSVDGILKAVDLVLGESRSAELGRCEAGLWKHVVDVEVLP